MWTLQPYHIFAETPKNFVAPRCIYTQIPPPKRGDSHAFLGLSEVIQTPMVSIAEKGGVVGVLSPAELQYFSVRNLRNWQLETCGIAYWFSVAGWSEIGSDLNFSASAEQPTQLHCLPQPQTIHTVSPKNGLY